MADGTWWRLKGCPRDVCHWLFYDRSRNGSGKWCAMSVCGNRTNTKAYRRRAAARFARPERAWLRYGSSVLFAWITAPLRTFGPAA